MTALRLGARLTLPGEFATEGVLVTGMRGSGKSNTEVRWAELLQRAGIPWVAIDPKGDWWGVQSSADGKSAGLPVPVFGGLHGNAPLEGNAEAGRIIADLLVDHNLSAVLDISRLSITGGRPAFLTAFFDRLMERHQVEPHTRCVIMEEAHRYIPQQVPTRLAALKEAAAAVLLEGRFVGLGCWAATQRPARLNKDVVEEVGTAIIHKIGVAATNDLRTVRGWLADHEQAAVHSGDLTKLRAGEAIVLAPEFDIVGRFQVDRRTTFDSGATPKAGATVRAPSTIADIDLGAIQTAMAASIERAKENDPVELRRRVRELEKAVTVAHRNLDAERAERQGHECPATTVEVVPQWVERKMDLLLRMQSAIATDATKLGDAIADVRLRIEDERGDGRQDADDRPVPVGGHASSRPVASLAPPPAGPAPGAAQRADPPQRREPRRAPGEGSAPGDVMRQRILDAAAWWAEMGSDTPTKVQVGLVAGYKITSKLGGKFGQTLARLVDEGAIAYPAPGCMTLTSLGATEAATPKIPRSAAGVQSAVMAVLDPMEQRILRPILDAHPDPIGKVDAGLRAGYEVTSKLGGKFGQSLARLKTLTIVTYPAPGQVRAADWLFLG